MLRFGVCRRDQFSSEPSLLHLLLHGRRVSYRLLRTSMPESSPADIEIFDHILYHLKLNGRIYTTTVPDRFRDVDPVFTRCLARVFTPDRALRVEDWGASDAATSVDWFHVLRTCFPHIRLMASDLTTYLVEAIVDQNGVYLLDPQGRLLQYVAPPFVIKFPEPAPLLINRWLAERARRTFQDLADRAEVDLAHLRFDDSASTIQRPPFVFRQIALTHPRARALRDADPMFQLSQHSVFEASPHGPDVIRTMNVLNRDFFSDEQLTVAVRAVWHSLTAGGVWIVGRTITESPRVHHASILQKTPTGFDVLERHVRASEVEGLALGLRG